MMKKVLLLVVDACASSVFVPALDNGQLPNLAALRRAGTLHPESIAIFPSITPAATSSILTGSYPSEHGIAGAHWYDPENDTVVYYGPDFWVIVDKGLGDFFNDFVYELNHERLRADTLFQTIENVGYTCACLNYLMFRGNRTHAIDAPLLLELMPGISFRDVCGPSIMYWGDFVRTPFDSLDGTLSSAGGPQNRFGFNDDATAELLAQMIDHNLMPEFTLAYFPNNDFDSHEAGPYQAVTTLETLDKRLGAIIEASGGIEALLDEFCVILTGDHSQTPVVDEKDQAGISLTEILEDFRLATPGEPWDEDDELLVCPNLRAAQIYQHRANSNQFERLIETVLQDTRIDQAIWQDTVTSPDGRGFRVATSDRGELHFWAGGDGANSATDEYGGVWSWEGDLQTVDGHVSEDGVITFPTYPNAFERIAGSSHMDHSGDLWMTAHPGYEFRLKHTSLHDGGGSHGSLHEGDSTSPLLIAGLPEDIDIPHTPRSVDVAPLCLRVLGIEPPYDVGASRVNCDAN